MRTLVAAAVIAASAATSACGRSRDEDPGPPVSQNYQVGNFNEVEVAGPFDVTIRTGAAPSVQAKGNQKLIERLIVEVKGNKLLIHPKQKHGWFGSWGSVGGKGEIAVTVPMIEAATLAGAGDLTSIAEVVRDLFRPDDAPEQSYSERQIFEAASSRLARELGAMEQTDEKSALAKILEILNKAALIHHKNKEDA
jgi:hypothetical protein